MGGLGLLEGNLDTNNIIPLKQNFWSLSKAKVPIDSRLREARDHICLVLYYISNAYIMGTWAGIVAQ